MRENQKPTQEPIDDYKETLNTALFALGIFAVWLLTVVF